MRKIRLFVAAVAAIADNDGVTMQFFDNPASVCKSI